MKKGVAYKFKNAQSRADFYNKLIANRDITTAIDCNDGQFYIGNEDDIGNYSLYKTDKYLTTLKNSSDDTCLIRSDEFHYFEEVNSVEQNTTLDKFDKAVASFREYRSDRPFSAELENALDMIRFGISIQN